ncbi:DUF6547 family protein [Paenibacillus sp. RC67]|uniref:DUF6547 family protein n=1 Tax=Paenibacillus sp. RC67 TaxID=3039392 RepID=UPI0024AE39CE|nr:DUF6547 family protein [Paenibacillus sp. RC67]
MIDKNSVELYKAFIDDLVDLRPGVLPRRIMGSGWPKTIETEKINKVLGELTKEQKEIFALITEIARDGGIHDVIMYLTDQMNLEGLELIRDGVRMAFEPFGFEMYYDWVCRREGNAWPDVNN